MEPRGRGEEGRRNPRDGFISHRDMMGSRILNLSGPFLSPQPTPPICSKDSKKVGGGHAWDFFLV